MMSLIKYSIGHKPYCQRCNRVVDFWSVEVRYGIKPMSTMTECKYSYTGEDTLTLIVSCHGEEFEETYRGTI